MNTDKNENLIRTADFAKMCGTTKRTLIHYEQIGLFLPTCREANGYRYYSAGQYELFQIIDTLRSIGMPLAEIRAYLQHRSPQTLEALLEAQNRRLEAELQRLEQVRQVVCTKRELLDAGRSVCCGRPELQETEEEWLILSEPVKAGEHMSALRCHLSAMAESGLRSGHPFGAMLKAEDVAAGNFSRYAYYFTKGAFESLPNVHCKPAGLYGVIHLRGDYRDPAAAMELLLAFLRENGKEPWGYCYKEGIIDEIAAQTPEQYITRISVPVR